MQNTNELKEMNKKIFGEEKLGYDTHVLQTKVNIHMYCKIRCSSSRNYLKKQITNSFLFVSQHEK